MFQLFVISGSCSSPGAPSRQPIGGNGEAVRGFWGKYEQIIKIKYDAPKVAGFLAVGLITIQWLGAYEMGRRLDLMGFPSHVIDYDAMIGSYPDCIWLDDMIMILDAFWSTYQLAVAAISCWMIGLVKSDNPWSTSTSCRRLLHRMTRPYEDRPWQVLHLPDDLPSNVQHWSNVGWSCHHRHPESGTSWGQQKASKAAKSGVLLINVTGQSIKRMAFVPDRFV